MGRPIKFNSIFGYSINSAEDGEKVQIAFRINCKDRTLERGNSTMISSILDDLAYPEVMRRIKDGNLLSDFRLKMVHMVMFGDQTRNDILLNEEVRFIGHIKFEEGKKFEVGCPVNEADIKDIIGFYPSSKNDPNAAHVMLGKFRGQWYFACDLIYDRERVRKRFETAKTFLKVSDYCMRERHWGPFADNLFSATELGIQSFLLLLHHPTFSTNQDHETTNKLFYAYAEQGNIDIRYANHYNNLIELRKKGRYLTGLHNSIFLLDKAEAEEMLFLTNDLFGDVTKLLESIDVSRKPPDGDYILFGQA